jgi:dephospho-CoA kinase
LKLKKNLIIAVVGMAGAGKSSACTYLKKHGFTVLRFGDQTDIGLKEQGLALTEQNERKYREKLRKELGMAAYAVKIEPRIKKALEKNHKIALDGLYSWEEYLYLKKKIPDLILLCVYTTLKKRYERLSGRQLRALPVRKAGERDVAELINLHKGAPIALADYLVVNDSSLKNFHRQLKKLLNEII